MREYKSLHSVKVELFRLILRKLPSSRELLVYVLFLLMLMFNERHKRKTP